MRLKPPITADAAYTYLSLAAVTAWGVADAAKMDPQLRAIADAMAVVSALDIPEHVEPLFGEDIAQDPEFAA
jgi:hypothetical protein